MAHPYHQHRQHKVEHRRVGHIAHGYASGGGVRVEHTDEGADRKLFAKMFRERDAQAAEGEGAAQRRDRPHRARGGKVSGKKHHGKTNVNVIVAPSAPPAAGGLRGPQVLPGGPVAAGAPVSPQTPPPRPPMPPQAGVGPVPPGIGASGAPVIPPGMRRAGGRTGYAKGGGVKDGPAWREGIRNATPVQHNESGKLNMGDVGRGKPITYRQGGAVRGESSDAIAPATKLPGGSGGARARLAKEKRAAKDYARA
jgi:hypothetical protein